MTGTAEAVQSIRRAADRFHGAATAIAEVDWTAAHTRRHHAQLPVVPPPD